MTKDSTFKQYASTVIDEVAGIHFYNSNDSDEIQTDRSEQLGTLFRNNFYHSITNDVVPVIPSSLVATYPYNSETPIQTLIQTYQVSKGFQSFEEAAKTWMNEYSKALLGLVIPLYSKYGIALEHTYRILLQPLTKTVHLINYILEISKAYVLILSA